MTKVLKKTLKPSGGSGTKLLGGFVPESFANYLTLYCHSSGITKSYILNSLIKRWTVKTMNRAPEKELMQAIAEKAVDKWQNPRRYKIPFMAFVAQFRNELKNKGLVYYEDAIIELMKNEKTRREIEQTNEKSS